jgi:hypothetical protein
MVPMRFVNPEQHSLEQIANIERTVSGNDMRSVSLNDALFFATQLVLHGSLLATGFLRSLTPQVRHPDALTYLHKLRHQLAFIQSLKHLREVKEDQVLVSKLYEPEGYVFSSGAKHPEKLIVVFTTMFNNFQISNVALYALLKEFGVSSLILKDCTYSNYLNGVSGLGTNIHSLAQGISALAREDNISEIYLMGFSSGGYSSLYASFLLPCSGYTGFSLLTDLSKGSHIDPGPFFSTKSRDSTNEAYLINLRNLADATNDRVKRQIFFGADSAMDTAHAKNMDGVPNLQTIKVKNCGHDTVAALIERRKFYTCIRNLLF